MREELPFFKERIKFKEEKGFYEPLPDPLELPGKIIRELPLNFFPSKLSISIEKGTKTKVYNPCKTIEEACDYLSKAKKMFFELKKEYNISTPDVEMIITKNKENKDSIFMIIDKIEGKTIADILEKETISLSIKKKLDDHYSQLLQYFFDRYKERGPFFHDITGIDQLMWGHKANKKNEEDKIYLVDIEPFIFSEKLWEEKEDTVKEICQIEMLEIMGQVMEIEENLKTYKEKDEIFGKVREKIKEILKEISSKEELLVPLDTPLLVRHFGLENLFPEKK